MDKLRNDILAKHGSLYKAAPKVGTTYLLLWRALENYEAGKRIRLSTKLAYSRLLDITLRQFEKKYLQD
jgi:hypothetical protein